MPKQIINTGTANNSHDGDTLRTAFTKINANFAELYSISNADVQIPPQTQIVAGRYLRTSGASLSFQNISYNDLTDKPVLFSGAYGDLTGAPYIFSGSYNDLTNKPNIFSGHYNDLVGKPTLFSGSYNDLSDKPNTISLDTLKTVVDASSDFADFKARIAAL